MTQNRVDSEWSTFLGRTPMLADSKLAEFVARDKCVLITGAGGFIGSRLVRAVIAGRALKVVLLDLSESGLYECCRDIHSLLQGKRTAVVPVVGSIRDEALLTYILKAHRPDLILHAAAYKHVPLMEQNPFAALANNAIGTYRLAAAGVHAGVSQLLLISTDKAVNPRSIMGASKRIAELAVLSLASKSVRMNAVRLGNVLGSSGSVAPLFQEQVDNGAALTITDKEATRYFLTPEEADVTIMQAAESDVWDRVLLADCGGPIRIEDLARYIAAQAGAEPRIEYIGLRPGDKLHEKLVSDMEVVEARTVGGLLIVRSPTPGNDDIATAMMALGDAIGRFDRSQLMELVQQLVPSYKASKALMGTR